MSTSRCRRDGPRQCHVRHLGSAAQGGVIRHRGIQAGRGGDGADQPFGLTQRQAGHGLQWKRLDDGRSRTARLAASCGPQLNLAGRARRVGESDRKVAAPAKAGGVGCRVPHPVPRPGDMVATCGVGCERHGETPWNAGGCSDRVARSIPVRSIHRPMHHSSVDPPSRCRATGDQPRCATTTRTAEEPRPGSVRIAPPRPGPAWPHG